MSFSKIAAAAEAARWSELSQILRLESDGELERLGRRLDTVAALVAEESLRRRDPARGPAEEEILLGAGGEA